MRTPWKILIDAWSYLNYKPIMADDRPSMAVTWLREDDARRLAAYKVLTAYDHNQAGELTATTGDPDAVERRELGDPGTVVDTALAYCLGPEQTIVVPDAADDTAAADIQERLRAWAKAELFPMRLQYAERRAILLGDAVYRLAWDPERGRATLRVVDPGLYFPVIDDDGDVADYPTRVHLAWELPEDREKGLKARVRRITYELGPIRPATGSMIDVDGVAARVTATTDDGTPLTAPGDVYDPETGLITRTYPWAPTKPSGITCHLTDAEWNLEDLRAAHHVDNLPANKARYRVRRDGEVLDHLDLRIDFVPVVHVPNSVTGEDHWGESTLSRPLQLLDELAGSDTDSSSASATTGSPILGLAGSTAPVDRATGRPAPVTVAPGAVFYLGESGRLDALDTSNQLSELRSRVDHLRARLSSITRLPGAALGTVDPTKVPSGYLLDVSLRPLDALVGSMRLARAHKYTILFKFVQRLHQAGLVWPGGESRPVVLQFGPHTPTDRAGVLTLVIQGVTAGVLSKETGLRMLQTAGFPIEDATAEIAAIQARDFDGAARLADATGDNGVVRGYLGLRAADNGVPRPVPSSKI